MEWSETPFPPFSATVPWEEDPSLHMTSKEVQQLVAHVDMLTNGQILQHISGDTNNYQLTIINHS